MTDAATGATPATSPSIIDLRSDTVTRPSPGMRAAMAAAEVGDDVLGDDPTVNELQRRTADLLGTETSLFVPSGSMANLIAVMLHCRPGDEVIVGQGAHIAFHEVGSAAALAGVQLVAVGDAGTFTADDIVGAARRGGRLEPPTRLVAVENTHNRAGGAVWNRETLSGVIQAARERDLRLHLDGARALNAAVASGCSVVELCAGFDTVSFAFSKGLGAPIGSVLAGRWPDIDRATRLRKMLGGAMRQAGVVAAAALWALDHNQHHIVTDHENARVLADGLRDI
ncbi:MAG: threonine aldolase family protein, partial [Pseudomonadota bacterium]